MEDESPPTVVLLHDLLIYNKTCNRTYYMNTKEAKQPFNYTGPK
jgi:hypothetical protein